MITKSTEPLVCEIDLKKKISPDHILCYFYNYFLLFTEGFKDDSVSLLL